MWTRDPKMIRSSIPRCSHERAEEPDAIPCVTQVEHDVPTPAARCRPPNNLQHIYRWELSVPVGYRVPHLQPVPHAVGYLGGFPDVSLRPARVARPRPVGPGVETGQLQQSSTLLRIWSGELLEFPFHLTSDQAVQPPVWVGGWRCGRLQNDRGEILNCGLPGGDGGDNHSPVQRWLKPTTPPSGTSGLPVELDEVLGMTDPALIPGCHIFDVHQLSIAAGTARWGVCWTPGSRRCASLLRPRAEGLRSRGR